MSKTPLFFGGHVFFSSNQHGLKESGKRSPTVDHNALAQCLQVIAHVQERTIHHDKCLTGFQAVELKHSCLNENEFTHVKKRTCHQKL